MKVSGSRSQTRAIQAQLGLEEKKRNLLTGSSLVAVKQGKDFNHQLAKQLIASGAVEYLEPNYIVSINQQIPNDPSFSLLWGIHNTSQTGGVANVDVDAPEAWNLSTGDASVVVGVVDTGIDYGHEDLQSRMWINPGEIAGNGIDDDGNGVSDDIHGFNAINQSGNPYDDNGHGTHCAGTIGANGNNGIGVAGVAWNVRLMALKFLDQNGSGSTQAAIEAIEYAVRMRQAGVNLRVLSNSWGGGGYSQALSDAIASAESAGILFVAAAGNSANDNDFNPTYPADYEVGNVLSVAAIDDDGNLASFSNYGQVGVDIAAPGVSIYSTRPDNSYAHLSGTSMATPHVSGVAALLASYAPSLSVAELKNRLLSTAKPLDSLVGVVATGGMVSAYNALQNVSNPNPPDQNIPGYATRDTGATAAALGTRILNVDDGYVEQVLPFSFPYYQRGYQRVAVSSNGRIIPLSDGEGLPTEADYSNRVTRAISPYHDDLYPSQFSTDQGVWYHNAGSYVVFSWVSVDYSDRASANPASEIRFQVRLYSSGLIEFHYLDTDAAGAVWSNAGTATVSLAPGSAVNGRNLLLSHNAANPERVGSGRAIQMYDDSLSSPPGGTPGEPTPPTPPAPPAPPSPLPPGSDADLDGDGKRDLVVWRPNSGMWYILGSQTDYSFSQHRAIQHGLPGDIPKLGDFDRDGQADLAVWRPQSGMWYLRLSTTGYTTSRAIQWGLFGDIPLVGDYDGDGWHDLAVYRVRTGTFYVLRSEGGFNASSANQGNSAAILSVQLGGPAHDVLVGDFLGEGKDNFVSIWQLVRFWAVKDNFGQLRFSLPWGQPGDTPLACNTVSRSRDARVMVRVAPDFTLHWFAVDLDGAVRTDSFGSIGDTPRCADHDADGVDDLFVYRNHSGEWFIRDSSTGALRSYQFGLPGDVPL